MTSEEDQIAALTNSLNSLENESRKLLNAVQWSSKVRKILFVLVLLFAVIAVFIFYRLFVEIRDNRITKIQQIISEQPEEFVQPLTREVVAIAEKEGPYLADVFRKQAQDDTKLYIEAIEKEQNTLVDNLQKKFEKKVLESYAMMLDEQEATLKKEFPVLRDPEKMKYLRKNMEDVYEKIGKRYFVDNLKEEMESLVSKLEKFPASTPNSDTIPVAEQIATEFLELVQMMVVNSNNYVIPNDEGISPAITPVKQTSQESTQKVADSETAPEAKKETESQKESEPEQKTDSQPEIESDPPVASKESSDDDSKTSKSNENKKETENQDGDAKKSDDQ
ncbi:MAG: hypothetical protein AAF939_11015 [Planctomycetota bacterium]